MKKSSLVLAAIFLLFSFHSRAQSTLHLTKTLMIGGAGGWDYLAAGPVNNWLYVSHGTKVNVINKITGDSITTIENTTGVHGIAFDKELSKGFTSNGRLNTVTVFNMNTNEVLGQIATGQNPDAIFYEPYSKKIITCNGRSNNLSIIDPVKGLVTDSVALTGKPETAVSDGNGNIYVNIEDKNEITVVSAKNWSVLQHWSLSPAEGPTGLAIDPDTKKLFAGCDKLLVVIDINTGHISSQLPIGDGCDGVAFDRATKNIYTSNGEGTLTVIHEDKDGKFAVVKNIPTKRGARTIALDEKTHQVFLPTAEFEPLAPGKKRPDIKAGSFQVLVLEN
jgi:DNA-binding beta-propeller fold protein YncE